MALPDPERVILTLVRDLEARQKTLVRRNIALNCLFYALWVGFFLTLLQKLNVLKTPLNLTFVVGQILLWCGVFLIAFIGGLIKALGVKVDPVELLLLADKKLTLKERLTTAYEYLRKDSQIPLREKLLASAVWYAQWVKPQRILPDEWPGKFRMIPLLIVGVLGIFSLDLSSLSPFPTESRQGIFKEPTKGKGSWKDESESRKSKVESQEVEAPRLSREIRNLNQKIRTGEISREEGLFEIASLQRRLSRELTARMARISPRDLTATEVQQVLENPEGLQSELKGLMALQPLKGYSLQSLLDIEKELKKLLNSHLFGSKAREALEALQSGDLDRFRGILEELDSVSELAEGIEELRMAKKPPENLHRSRSGWASSSNSQVAKPQGNWRDEGEKRFPRGEQGLGAFGDPLFDGGEWGFGEFEEKTGVKDSLGVGEEKTSRDPQRILQITGKQGEGRSLEALIRTLPLKNQAWLSTKDVVVHYQTEVESALVQEEIPFHLREYVKNYFLNIGIMEEATD